MTSIVNPVCTAISCLILVMVVAANVFRAIHVTPEGLQSGLGGKAEILKTEQILEAAKQGVVVIWLVVAARLYIRRNDECSSSAAAKTAAPRRDSIRTRGFVAARAGVGFFRNNSTAFDFNIGFVEGDYQHAVLLVCGRVQNPRYERRKEAIGGYEMTAPADFGSPIMTVVAEVGRDEREVRSLCDAAQVVVEPSQRNDILRAGRMIDDRMKVDERIMPGGVLRFCVRMNVAVGLAEAGMLAVGIHVFHIALPA